MSLKASSIETNYNGTAVPLYTAATDMSLCRVVINLVLLWVV